METLLFVNACVREDSRTMEMANHLLIKWNGKLETADLNREDIRPLDREGLRERDRLLEAKAYDAPVFRHARLLKTADVILIAAPYWDLSYPACLKAYLEAVNISGITFEYTLKGIPRGLCRARKFIYVTTAGGRIMTPDFGFEYIKTLSRMFWGIRDSVCYSAEGLDIVGADSRAILEDAIQRMDPDPFARA